jgi:ankyrin repeat protein
MVGHAAVAQLLMDAGADIEAREDSGMTPLMFAGGNGHVVLNPNP